MTFDYIKIFRKIKWYKKTLHLLVWIALFSLLAPQTFTIPVKGATKSDYHPDSFWFYPWGKSGTHKGVDIFARKGTSVVASTHGFILATGENKRGGKFIFTLGPKLRVHYYAHLNSIKTKTGYWNNSGEKIGEVGSTGNAAGKPPHLHYSIITLIPHFWKVDLSPQGWKKIFFLNPIEFIEK
tara:strand:+ start:6867 stop:7412 length:546 start_codon:yes stop_codon:yes gene_type:complete